MDSKNSGELAKEALDALLEPCFADPPTAGAIVLINNVHGTQFFSVNMEAFEAVATLLGGGAHLEKQLGLETGVMQ